MGFKLNKILLSITLILLQSCSGGRIGNFLENSFKNDEEPKIKEDNKNNLNNNISINSDENTEKNKKIEEPKINEDNKNNLNNNISINSDENTEKNKKIEEPKINEDNKNNLNYEIVKKSEINSKKNNKKVSKNISFKKKQYQPQSYKIIFILKDVDPKDPIENLRSILRNSDVNFEIEKIERFFDPKNKSIKRN